LHWLWVFRHPLCFGNMVRRSGKGVNLLQVEEELFVPVSGVLKSRPSI
jgi:hypothetical protein